jgi:hypothetical protein
MEAAAAEAHVMWTRASFLRTALADLVAHISNFDVIGEKFSTLHIAPNKERVRNHIPLRLSGLAIDLYQLPVVFGDRAALRGQWVHTTKAYVRDVSAEDRSSAESVIADLCHLLSFATMSEVRSFAFEYPEGMHRVNGIGRISAWRTPIEQDGKAVSAFVHQAWTRYRDLTNDRSLPELIHYLSICDVPDQPLEVRMLLAFVALEHMKYSWARAKGIPFDGAYFLKPRDPKSNRRAARYGLKELLEMMFAEQGMTPDLTPIVKVRNQIVHMGVTRQSHGANRGYYERTKALQHEYLLRLLGYSGQFYDYETSESRVLTGAT